MDSITHAIGNLIGMYDGLLVSVRNAGDRPKFVAENEEVSAAVRSEMEKGNFIPLVHLQVCLLDVTIKGISSTEIRILAKLSREHGDEKACEILADYYAQAVKEQSMKLIDFAKARNIFR